jgi:hypothetical protein
MKKAGRDRMVSRFTSIQVVVEKNALVIEHFSKSSRYFTTPLPCYIGWDNIVDGIVIVVCFN